jgi:hypothetical protein
LLVAEQVELAEKAFHEALARRNEAQIAYLLEASIITHIQSAKTVKPLTLEILDAKVRWLARPCALIWKNIARGDSQITFSRTISMIKWRLRGRWDVEVHWRTAAAAVSL